jgi:hypothetical protein
MQTSVIFIFVSAINPAFVRYFNFILLIFVAHSVLLVHFLLLRSFLESRVLFTFNFVSSIESHSHRCVFWIQLSLHPSKCHVPFSLIFPHTLLS